MVVTIAQYHPRYWTDSWMCFRWGCPEKDEWKLKELFHRLFWDTENLSLKTERAISQTLLRHWELSSAYTRKKKKICIGLSASEMSVDNQGTDR